jgi:hypothetical protein
MGKYTINKNNEKANNQQQKHNSPKVWYPLKRVSRETESKKRVDDIVNCV